MVVQTLDDWARDQDDLVETLRKRGGYYEEHFPVVPNEYTNWIDEIRASVEASALADLSHHMTAVHLEGPDVLRFLSDLCINDFDDFAVGRAKQIVMCNYDGKIMGDGPLLRLDEEVFHGPGIHATKWLAFNIEIGEYDVDAEFEPPTPMLPGDPEEFVFQVQGPTANEVLSELTDSNLGELGFYSFEDITLAGRKVRAFGHGMSPESGFELHGPYEFADDLRTAIVEAGEEYGLRELGSKTYVSNSVRLGWIPPFIKPVYVGEEMRPYREWATPKMERKYGKFWAADETFESSFSINGSFESDDVRDYYMSPLELGYGKLIDFDHDFVGKQALEREFEDPTRSKVSLLWDRSDVNRVNNSLFEDGKNFKYMSNLPRVGWARMAYDEVLKDGELIGISHSRSFEWDVRCIVSLARVDVEHCDPGTEVAVVWGEPGGRSPNPKIENHTQTEIAATVTKAPYVEDRR